MFLQGDLQAVFDALYSIGAIDPVLKLDWNKVTEEMKENLSIVHSAFEEINACSGNREKLVRKLSIMNPRDVNYIALEVAREFCEFQDRNQTH